MTMHQIDYCCSCLMSNKISDRKKSCESLSQLILDDNIIKSLDADKDDGWNNIFKAANKCGLKEIAKVEEELQKGRSIQSTEQQILRCSKLIMYVVRQANIRGGAIISVSSFISYIQKCNESATMKKYFLDSYIIALSEYILTEEVYWGQMEAQEWITIFDIAQNFYTESNSLKALECIHLIIRHGSKYQLSREFLLTKIEFVYTICSTIKPSSSRLIQTAVLSIFIDFNNQFLYDYRMLCCKLGERVIENLLGLYEATDCHPHVKNVLYELLLLQVKLHNPMGALQSNSMAYADSWPIWNRLLRHIYINIIREELKADPKNLIGDQNENRIIPMFLELSIEIFNQVYTCGQIDFTSSMSATIDTQAAKRKCVDVVFPEIMQQIQERCWPWINITTELLKKYPELITEDEFTSLLKILSEIVTECKTQDIRTHTCECLAVLVDVEETLHLDANSYQHLWSIVWDSTLRSAGLNQTLRETHKLLQKLIKAGKIQEPMQFLNTYLSKVIARNKHSLETLNVYCSIYGLTDTGPNSGSVKFTRETLIQWVLKDNVINYTEEITARVLLYLTLNYWPPNCDSKMRKTLSNDFWENLYRTNNIDSDLITTEMKAETNIELKQYIINKDAYDVVILLLKTIEKYTYKNKSVLINVIMLICNFLKLLSHHKIDSGEELRRMLTDLLVMLWEVVESSFKSIKHRFNAQHFDLMKKIEVLFKMDGAMQFIVKKSLTLEVMRTFFHFLQSEPENEEIGTYVKPAKKPINKFKIVILNVICAYIFSDAEFTSDLKFHGIRSLASTEPNPNAYIDYKLSITFLDSIKHCKGTLEDDILEGILLQLQTICEHRHKDYAVAIDVLSVLSYLYPQLVESNNDILRENCIILLAPFYEYRTNYGPKVSVAVANCLGQIAKIDPVGKFKWNNGEDIPAQLPALLCSPYQEVRLAAIKNMFEVFSQASSADRNLFNRQQVIFKKVCSKSMKLLNASSDDENESTRDEIITKTSSVLYTFATIMTTSSVWRQQALFELLKIVFLKELDTEKVVKILNKVSKDKNACELIESDINYLILQWNAKELYLQDFPYKLLHCESPLDFYVKYITIIIPILINEDDDLLFETVCQKMGIQKVAVIEDSYPAILAKYLVVKSGNDDSNEFRLSPADIDIGKNTHHKLKKYLTDERCSEIFIERFDDIVFNLTQMIFDAEEFQSFFKILYLIPEPNISFISVNIFKNAVTLLDRKLQSQINITIFDYIVVKQPNKLQKILLKLVESIYKSSSVEEKLLCFHRYTIFLSLILGCFEKMNDMKQYLIRDISMTLLNMIKYNYKQDGMLNLISCKYLSYFIDRLMPQCAHLLETIVITVISTLVPIANCDYKLSVECLRVINKLVVDNASQLMKGIEILDPFPENSNTFTKIQEVYLKVKYGNSPYAVQEEIEHFIKAGERVVRDGCRMDGLTFLRKMLVEKKHELKTLYTNLFKTRGSLGEKSVLHRLICMLVKLTGSTDANVSFEATRCLGELGPADLSTMVLQTDVKLVSLKTTPIHTAIACILSLLLEYIVDEDIELVQVASNALYDVLASIEGKFVINSGSDYGYGILDKSYLTPFLSTTKGNKSLEMNGAGLKTWLSDKDLWCPEYPISHDKWISNLLTNILNSFSDTSFFKKLIPVCQSKFSFAETLLPHIINILMNISLKDCVNKLTDAIDAFFSRHWDLNQADLPASYEICMQKSSLQCMLNTVHFVRTQNSMQKKMSKTGSNIELNINYLKVAQAAQYCSAHFTALMYTELWCQIRVVELRKANPSIWSSMTVVDVVCEHDEKDIANAVQSILRQAYVDIGDLDALYGSQLINLLDRKARINRYKNLNRWDQVVLHYDIQASHGIPNSVENQLDALKKFSLIDLASNYKVLNEPEYECLWRLGNWSDVNIKSKTFEENRTFDKNNYIALKAFNDNDVSNFTEAISAARNCVIEDLKQDSLESCKNLYKSLTRLQCLQELEDCHTLGDNFSDMVRNWEVRDSINCNEFKYKEPIMAHRITLLNILYQNGKADLKNDLINMQLNLSEMARADGYLNVATRAITNLMHMDNLSEEVKAKIMLENAQICWETDKTTGKFILKHLLKSHKEPSILRALALKLYGTWMVETSSENPQAIISDYFLESIDILQNLETDHNHQFHEAYALLARFADQQYKEILKYTKSSLFKGKIQSMEKLVESANKMKNAKNAKTPDVRKAIVIYERQSVIDQTEINNTHKEKDTYLQLAVKYYLHNLQHSNENNIKMFRIISIWLENRSNAAVGKLMIEFLPSIPTFKIISVLPQIIPHIGSSTADVFGKLIPTLIERCAKDHPHHALPIILSVANSNKDDDYISDTPKSTETNEPRVIAAQKMLSKLKATTELKTLILQMEVIVTAVMQLAYLDVPANTENTKLKIPDSYKIVKIKNFAEAIIPTYSLPIRKDGNYNNIVGIHSFGKDFFLVGGVNAPKRVTCIGTDGIERKQLIKGKDDLRQDAVMQQVFNIMNGLLAANKQTCNLLIRTYKVVPFSKRSGILEWVDETMPFGEYLTGKEGAHRLYNPEDISPEKCRTQFKALAKEPYDVKLRKYQDICQRFHPAFHKFFETTFLQPTVWYERKRAFTHSVATTSMCGYILGLGDRHVNNILIDKNSAEVIHIDFGIAFEQGRVLPTPETVPFRLTRDIEAGMGVSGVEGTFRRSCENTMKVLRNNAETIITILEVLLYDPLYLWTITPAQAYSRQFDKDDATSEPMTFSDSTASDSQGNLTAERTLMRLQQKLQGTENGGFASVEGQVEQLIQKAREPANLCKVFAGWQPYL